MNKVIDFAKREAVFVISGGCALISTFFVPPSAAYLSYINTRVLMILFCMMAVVSGFQKVGAFDVVSKALVSESLSSKRLSAALVFVCFFSSMLVTNDVALITFVPLTIYIMDREKIDSIIFLIVMETVAANLGSLLTPIGNPQNLFLYQHYNLKIGEFLKITLPLWGMSLIFIAVIMLFSKGCNTSNIERMHFRGFNRRSAIKYLSLFLLCILTVLRVVNIYVCFGIVLVVLLFTDRNVLGMIDYCLLLTFVNFFVLVGNLTALESVNSLVSGLIRGRALLSGVLASQVISNVPAAVMLAHFTQDFRELILGVNIGGLGTLVASLASLISFKYYSLIAGASKRRYLMVFSIVNFAILIVLLLIFML